MTRHEIEESLKQWNTMVHDPKAFKPNCLCKFAWEDKYGNDIHIFINDAQSIEDFVNEFSKNYELNDMVNSVISITLICRACCAIFGEFGLSANKAERVMDAVYTANMTKKRGANAKRGDGQTADAVKPADFVPPETKIAEILGMSEAA